MKTLKLIQQCSALVLFLFAVFVISANAQLTSVSQLKDVKTTDNYYAAVKSLVESYGVLGAFPDNTFRGDSPLTREQFVVILNRSIDRMNEVNEATYRGEEPDDDDLGIMGLINVPYDVNKTFITSTSQIKDVKPSAAYYAALQSLVERYGINIADADNNLRAANAITEKEFYIWIGGIFGGKYVGSASATNAITRGASMIIMNDALNSMLANIEANSAVRAEKRKFKIIKALPSTGRAQIVKQLKFYLPGSSCPDLSAADMNLTLYAADDKWGDYRIKKGDIGDIIYETRNTCSKGGKIVMLRVGTAIVTMMEEGIKRIK